MKYIHIHYTSVLDDEEDSKTICNCGKCNNGSIRVAVTISQGSCLDRSAFVVTNNNDATLATFA